MASRAVSRFQASLATRTLRSPLSAAYPLHLQTLGGVRYGSSGAAENLKKTPLYDFHVKQGGKMVPFAGHHMPVQYSSSSLAQSHQWTRENASVFDVSHMVQHIFKGPDAAAFLERITPSSWATQEIMQGKLTAMLWPETGGIVDDTVITRLGEDEFYVVTNGACFEKDCKYLEEQLAQFGGNLEWTRLDNSGLVALQGPKAVDILKKILATDIDMDNTFFGQSFWADLKVENGTTHPVLITRAGYTGEDGFELSFQGGRFPAAETTNQAVEAILKAGGENVQMAGLGARDSLRLEAGMCLYGHDLDDTTTPVEAALSWIIPKERRDVNAGFHGAEKIIPQMTTKAKGGAGVERRRVGFVVEGAPAREGAEIQVDGEKIGVITSGSPSPTMGKNIAMGYIKNGMHKSGTEVDVVVRGKKRKGVVTKMPFVPTRLVRQP